MSNDVAFKVIVAGKITVVETKKIVNMKVNSEYRKCSRQIATHDLTCLVQPVASTINTLAGALYRVFSASPDPVRKQLRQACFDYLSLGGIFSNGPMALLSGLNPHPLSLVLHFFAVAVYGVGRLLFPFPSFERIWVAARLIWVSAWHLPTPSFSIPSCSFFPHMACIPSSSLVTMSFLFHDSLT